VFRSSSRPLFFKLAVLVVVFTNLNNCKAFENNLMIISIAGKNERAILQDLLNNEVNINARLGNTLLIQSAGNIN
jgi:hypothetical protein